jgi:C_GCAxxG_C_C family probable redox protein
MALKNLSHEDLLRQVEHLHKQYVEERVPCSERTFLAVHSVVDTELPSQAMALLTCFAGGVGHTTMCGAVAGGIAALGLTYGRQHPTETRSGRAGEIARAFLCQFRSRFGSELCGVLIGDTLHANTSDSEARRQRCRAYSLYAVKLCVDLLAKYETIYGKE